MKKLSTFFPIKPVLSLFCRELTFGNIAHFHTTEGADISGMMNAQVKLRFVLRYRRVSNCIRLQCCYGDD